MAVILVAWRLTCKKGKDNASGKWPGKIVTEVVPETDFWDAEAEHQDYLQKHPNGYTCHFERPGWKLEEK